MAVTALIRYTQATVGTAGVAYLGTVAAGVVTVNNGDNTNVASWRITLLDVPPGSALALGVLATANNSTPSATFTPDVPGSYRILLDVFDASGLLGLTDRDVRNFGVLNARGFLRPPYQKLPDPLPVTGSGKAGEKPDEQNYGGQARGWAGNRTDGQLETFFERFDDTLVKPVPSTPFTATATNEEPLYYVSVTGAAVFNMPASGFRVGQKFRISTASTVTTLTVTPPGGHTIEGLSTFVMFGNMSGTFIYRGSSSWIFLGAKKMSFERTVMAGVGSTSETSFQAIGALALNPSDFPNLVTVTWNVVLETTNVSDSAEIRLYNVTTSTLVTGSVLNTTSLIPTALSSSIVLTAGSNVYEAQLRLTGVGNPDRATCKQAQILIGAIQ